ncbi:MAG: hypothetical protein LBS31_00240 [Candidatus Adiutrix sp.]|jgi:hypothetical protein|nr:hypothetical protein [Candidatus Adiutrix sp.]
MHTTKGTSVKKVGDSYFLNLVLAGLYLVETKEADMLSEATPRIQEIFEAGRKARPYIP